MEIYEIILWRQSGSSLSAEVGDGARYWRLIEAGVDYSETIKSPCIGRGLVGLGSFSSLSDYSRFILKEWNCWWDDGSCSTGCLDSEELK